MTFTGIYRAKGNEAGMVYVINAQDCHGIGQNLASIRNRLFTAITRSKAWVRVVGVGDRMEAIKAEYNLVRDRDFKLSFTYPTSKQRKQLWLIHRGMTNRESDRIQKHNRGMKNLVSDLQSGRIHKEDLNAQELLEKLTHLLDS